MENGIRSSRNWPYLAAYFVLWGVFLAALVRKYSFSPQEALAGFVILALIFPALALLVTRRTEPLTHSVRHPWRETLVLLVYLVFVAVVLVQNFGPARSIKAEPQHTLAVFALKLVLFVTVPAFLLVALERYSLSDLFTFSLRRSALLPALWMSLAAIAMQAFLGRGLHDIHDSGLSTHALVLGIPLNLTFLLFEVGLVEEFFFRTLLQERLAAALRSPWGGIVVAAVLFGLVHAPGFYLRPAATLEHLGTYPSLFFAVGYSIVITSLAGLFLGVLWMRTKNLALVMLVHAAADLLPNVVPFCRTFHLH
ncbi:MAG TPA: CPBP family intramembrane glutamic endopeptidase [Candidatus Limnocylindrales bacterium]|nr:CPBP family intramembrane glutamic endopeptidase [Candidatus Limnocylindrales bacterium]